MLVNSLSSPFAGAIILWFYSHRASGTRPRRALCARGCWAGMEGGRGGRGEGAAATGRTRGRGALAGGQAVLPRRGFGQAAETLRPRPGSHLGRSVTRAGRGRRAHRPCPAAPLPGDAQGAGRIGFFSSSSRCSGASATSESSSLFLSAARSRGGGGRRRQGTASQMRVGVIAQDWKSRSDLFFRSQNNGALKEMVLSRSHTPLLVAAE